MGFWAFIIPILVQLLVTFLTSLLSGLNPPPVAGKMCATTLPNFQQSKSQFLDRVRWRFWLGPKRLQYAAALHDKMVSQFAINLSSAPLDVQNTVTVATAGLSSLTPADLGDK